MAQPMDRPTKPRGQATPPSRPPGWPPAPPSASRPPAKPPPAATGAAKPPARPPTGATGAAKPPRWDRGRLASFLLGVLLGMTVMLTAGTILWGFGILPIIEIYTDQGACPQAAPFLPMCPTCAAGCPETAVPHEGGGTPGPEADLLATATAACSVFQSQFPGTPCP